jgi:predicted metalloendopeptidase
VSPRKQVVSDPYSPRQYRATGAARNIDAWYEAFKVEQDDKMYVAPEHERESGSLNS